jgi:hypothetical protein
MTTPAVLKLPGGPKTRTEWESSAASSRPNAPLVRPRITRPGSGRRTRRERSSRGLAPGCRPGRWPLDSCAEGGGITQAGALPQPHRTTGHTRGTGGGDGEAGVHPSRSRQGLLGGDGPGQGRVVQVVAQLHQHPGDLGRVQLQPGMTEGQASELPRRPHQAARGDADPEGGGQQLITRGEGVGDGWWPLGSGRIRTTPRHRLACAAVSPLGLKQPPVLLGVALIGPGAAATAPGPLPAASERTGRRPDVSGFFNGTCPYGTRQGGTHWHGERAKRLVRWDLVGRWGFESPRSHLLRPTWGPGGWRRPRGRGRWRPREGGCRRPTARGCGWRRGWRPGGRWRPG